MQQKNVNVINVGQATPDNASQEACNLIQRQGACHNAARRRELPNLQAVKSVRARQAEPDLHRQQHAGFTLIELLVVVLIIGILATVAVPQYQKAVDKTKYMQAMTLGDKIAKAQQQYKLVNGTYSGRFEELDIDMPTPTSIFQENASNEHYNYKWGKCFITGGYDACIVQLDNSASVWYSISRHPVYVGQRGCSAQPKTNQRANALCQAMTKKTSGTVNGNYMDYRF